MKLTNVNQVNRNHHYTRNGGYTLLFAMLTAALVLGVSVFIISISRGQYLLSSTARESMYAVYAADSGLECGSLAAVSTLLSTTSAIGIGAGTISCGGISEQTISSYTGPSDYSGLKSRTAYRTITNLTFGTGVNTRCAQVTFIKGMTEDGQYPVTIIESRGYNRNCPVANATTDPLTVERALVLTHVGQE